MGVVNQANDFQTNCLNGIQETADNAYQQMLAKQAEYDAAKKQSSIFEQAKNRALVKFNSIKQQSKGQSNYNVKTAQAEYNSALSNYSNADINADVLRSSLQSSISYSGKMNNCAALANAILA